MTKMAAMPIYGKNPSKIFFFGTSRPIFAKLGTGQLRYLEFQGNGENTSSFPKFEIASYDVTRIHVHEQKCVHSNFRKIGIATKRVYACNPLCTTRTFYPQISWSDYGCG